MVLNVKSRKRPNYFMSDEEVKLLMNYVDKKYSMRWKAILYLCTFRGLRIQEALSVHISDFNADFTALRVIHCKSHIEDTLPLIPQLTEVMKEYICKYHMTFKEGYLFPYYNKKQSCVHLQTATAVTEFCKIRKAISLDHPEFNDHVMFGKYKRHRISFHSLRRWFETRVYDNIKDKKALADIMRYLDSSTVDTYLNPYETWKKERSILNDTFGNHISNFTHVAKGQTKLLSYIN